MQFTHPIFLWALTGLSIPLAIHLLSRKEGQVIKMGSLRHLRETSTQQFKGIKLNEFFLLALRSLLIILLVFLISGLHLADRNKKWVVVEKGVEENPLAKKLIDSLVAQNYELHWLQEGLSRKNEFRKDEPINYWHAISQLQLQELSQVFVLSYSYLEHAKGSRPASGENIQWITFPASENTFIADTIQLSDKIVIRQGHSQADRTSFETALSSNTVTSTVSIKQLKSITIVNDKKYEREKIILKASLLAIAKTLPVNFIIEEAVADNTALETDWVIWLSEKKTKTTDSSNYLFYEPTIGGESIKRMAKNRWSISQKLNLENAHKTNFTLTLASLLVDEETKWNKISYQDRRLIPDQLLMRGTTSSALEASADSMPAFNRWLLILFLLILVIERMVSYQRNQ
jgi:Aerotolerance regulator N-terminal